MSVRAQCLHPDREPDQKKTGRDGVTTLAAGNRRIRFEVRFMLLELDRAHTRPMTGRRSVH